MVGEREVRSGMDERGSASGRFVSRPTIRWVALRWFSAAVTWGVVDAGLSGTRTAPSLKRAYVIYRGAVTVNFQHDDFTAYAASRARYNEVYGWHGGVRTVTNSMLGPI